MFHSATRKFVSISTSNKLIAAQLFKSSLKLGLGPRNLSIKPHDNLENILTQEDIISQILIKRGESKKLEKFHALIKEINLTKNDVNQRLKLEKYFQTELKYFPNDTHEASVSCGNSPKVIKTVGSPLELKDPKELAQLCKQNNYLRNANLGEFVGTRPYVLKGFLAELERALISYTINFLKKEGFQFISVPDFLNSQTIESCGFPVNVDRTMVYEMETEEGEESIYLSGTAEMGIGAYLSNKKLNKSELPLKLAAVSRCFRAETSTTEEERGIYRVHNFTKVEMFGVTENDIEMSNELHEYICSLQQKLYSSLGLHFKVLEMPASELGNPAYRKFDIEAWMPGRKQFGEISSCSNCTDYQSSRLNISYFNSKTHLKNVHTLNGTACAIPRLIIALIETHQTENGEVKLPEIIQKYMRSEWGTKQNLPQVVPLKSRQLDSVYEYYNAWTKS